MDTSRPTRQKAGEWIRRYLPCEIAGTVGELGGAAVAYALTGSLAAAALAATVGAFVGYYAAAYANAVRWSFQSQRHRRLPSRIMVANLLALRSVAIEFGPGEVIDSVLIRPLAFYAVPMLVGNLLLGWIIAKIASDLVFYVCAIFSYERFNRSLARWRPPDEEVDDAIVATAAAS
jgi:hypothetical protein